MSRISDADAQKFAANGVNRTDAQMIRDISRHAFNEALATIERITKTAPVHLQPSITLSAMQGFVTLQKDLLETASKVGFRTAKI